MNWQKIKKDLYNLDYIASDDLAMCIHIATSLERPILLEGEAGIGKTALAIALSQLYDTKLIRLQCYEGLDSSSTIYEWNYQKQLLAIRSHEKVKGSKESIDNHIFSKSFLLKRPILKAITQNKMPILLIDEIDHLQKNHL